MAGALAEEPLMVARPCPYGGGCWIATTHEPTLAQTVVVHFQGLIRHEQIVSDKLANTQTIYGSFEALLYGPDVAGYLHKQANKVLA